MQILNFNSFSSDIIVPLDDTFVVMQLMIQEAEKQLGNPWNLPPYHLSLHTD
jgi:hypothetical protein